MYVSISEGYHCYIKDFCDIVLDHQDDMAVESGSRVSSLKDTLKPSELSEMTVNDRNISVAEIPSDTEIVINGLQKRKAELLARKSCAGLHHNDQEIDTWIKETEQYCSDYDMNKNHFDLLV